MGLKFLLLRQRTERTVQNSELRLSFERFKERCGRSGWVTNAIEAQLPISEEKVMGGRCSSTYSWKEERIRGRRSLHFEISRREIACSCASRITIPKPEYSDIRLIRKASEQVDIFVSALRMATADISRRFTGKMLGSFSILIALNLLPPPKTVNVRNALIAVALVGLYLAITNIVNTFRSMVLERQFAAIASEFLGCASRKKEGFP